MCNCQILHNAVSNTPCHQVGLRHKINDTLMIYPGYIPLDGVEPQLMHYGLKFDVGSWHFSKLDYHDDNIVYECNRLFSPPPFPEEVKSSVSHSSNFSFEMNSVNLCRSNKVICGYR